MSIEAMKQALEALEQSVSTCFDQYSHHEVMSRPEHFMNRAMEALRERLAQPEQEPVGEVLDERGEVDWISFVPPAGTSLYTSPPHRTWVGLTDQEIEDLWNQHESRFDYYSFSCDIEAKLKEKNKC